MSLPSWYAPSPLSACVPPPTLIDSTCLPLYHRFLKSSSVSISLATVSSPRPALPCKDYVYRDLRRKEKKIKDGSCPTISVAELMSAFPKYTDSIIRSRLKDKCMCVPVKGLEGDQIYCLREVKTQSFRSLPSPNSFPL